VCVKKTRQKNRSLLQLKEKDKAIQDLVARNEQKKVEIKRLRQAKKLTEEVKSLVETENQQLSSEVRFTICLSLVQNNLLFHSVERSKEKVASPERNIRYAVPNLTATQ
jgi:hypothetical protein